MSESHCPYCGWTTSSTDTRCPSCREDLTRMLSPIEKEIDQLREENKRLDALIRKYGRLAHERLAVDYWSGRLVYFGGYEQSANFVKLQKEATERQAVIQSALESARRKRVSYRS